MHKRIALALFITLFVNWSFARSVSASSSNIVISHVQAGGISTLDQAAAQELVILYNNSDVDVEVTNWCLENKSSVKFVCFTPTSVSLHYWLKSRSYLVVASEKFSVEHTFTPDFLYITTNSSSGSIVASSDSISLIDNQSSVIDSISWSSGITGGQYFERIQSSIEGVLVDTDNISDFVKHSALLLPISGLYEVVIIVDVCPNIDLVQESMPLGYEYDVDGNCMADICLNLIGLQLVIPENMKLGANGDCVYIDVCLNIAGNQISLPYGYAIDEYSQCWISASKILLTEIMPNISGVDVGREFIEIYNPTEEPIDLDLYHFNVGVDTEKSYHFPAGATLNPHQYLAFYNDKISFTLLNTSSKVAIETNDGQLVDSSDIYTSPKEDESWSLIDNLWQYTNQATPGATNLASQEVEIESIQTPCAPNQYRNPETNRCRLIVAKTNTLVPCKDNEYRSEETNRCRAVLGASTEVKQCDVGEYRNPDTGRCKKVVAISKLPYPNEMTSVLVDENNGYYFLAGLAFSIGSYGIWEWRDEIAVLVRKLGRNKL